MDVAAPTTTKTNTSEFIVGGRYRLTRKIDSGGFGDIYLGINITNGEVRKRFGRFFVDNLDVSYIINIYVQELAVKLESKKARHPQLLYESNLYKILQGGVGIPQMR
jgi:hypothetical protein